MKKKHIQELQRISQSLPKEIVENLQTVELAMPIHRYASALAIVDDSGTITEETRNQLKNLWKAGYFDETIVRRNPEGEKQADAYIQQQIDLSVKMGRLPKNYKISQLIKKTWQRKTKSLKKSSSKDSEAS